MFKITTDTDLGKLAGFKLSRIRKMTPRDISYEIVQQDIIYPYLRNQKEWEELNEAIGEMLNDSWNPAEEFKPERFDEIIYAHKEEDGKYSFVMVGVI